MTDVEGQNVFHHHVRGWHSCSNSVSLGTGGGLELRSTSLPQVCETVTDLVVLGATKTLHRSRGSTETV